MTYDPKRDPLTMHPLYSLMQGVLHVLNSTAYYDSGRWVMDRDEALTLVETAFKHKMEMLDYDVVCNCADTRPHDSECGGRDCWCHEPPVQDWEDPQWDIEIGT